MARKLRSNKPKPLATVTEEFAFHLANGSLVPEVLEGFDYLGVVMQGENEQTAVWVLINAADIDADFAVGNAEAAKKRAAQWIRELCDPTYHADPPFGDWETRPRTASPSRRSAGDIPAR